LEGLVVDFFLPNHFIFLNEIMQAAMVVTLEDDPVIPISEELLLRDENFP
jgi:hypothetical protein